MKTLLVLLSLFILSACGSAQKKVAYLKPDTPAAIEARRDMMVGRWVGEMPTVDGKFYKWLVERRTDGGFTLQAQLKEQGKIVEQNTEFGFWGVSGHVYFSMTREMMVKGKTVPLNTNTANYYDAYEIVELGEGRFKYQHVETGNVYLVHRVANDYQL